MKSGTLRFSCTGCGDCCTGDPRVYWVETTRTEQNRIARFLGISLAWFRRRYVAHYDDGAEGLSMKGGQCVFLDTDRRCRIYAARPQQCRGYPFWPEVIVSAASWQREARRCEGIGRGNVVSLKSLRARIGKP